MGRVHRNLGSGAIVCLKWKSIRPLATVKQLFPNDYRIRRGTFSVVGIEENYNFDGASTRCLKLSHADHGDCEFFCKYGSGSLIRSGPPNQYFRAAPVQQSQPEVAPSQLPQTHTVQQQLLSNDTENGFGDNRSDRESDIDEEETDPSGHVSNAEQVQWGQFCDSINVDSRGGQERWHAKLVSSIGELPNAVTPFMMFKKMLPLNYIAEHVIPATNEELQIENQFPMNMIEMYLFLALHFVMSLNPAHQQRDFFQKKERDLFFTAPYLGHLMSRRRFESILSCFRLRSDIPPVDHRDRFWNIRKLIDAFNENMQHEYMPSWIVCVDESMVVFHNPYAPGWITIKRKPHPFGNEYHATACAETGILFFIEIVEGSDRPQSGPHSDVPLLNETQQKTAALVLRMTKTLWGSGRVVMLDSGFGGIPTISNLARKGLYGTCVIKKKRYWPAQTEAEQAINDLYGRPVGTVRVRKGSVAGVDFHLSAMADTKHTAIYLTNWGTTHKIGPKRKRRLGNDLIEIQYPEYIHFYYFARHAVDDNNNNRQGSLSFEETFNPKRWDLRQFGFIIALALTNSMLAYNKFIRAKSNEDTLSNAEYRRMLAQEMLSWVNEQEGHDSSRSTPATRRRTSQCKILHLKKGQGKWKNSGFRSTKDPYPKYNCSGVGCNRRIRTYCSCDPTAMMCTECWPEHLSELPN